MKERKQVVLFDGVCNLCDGFVQFVIRRDPKAQFSFGTLQSTEAQRLVASTELQPADLKTVIYLKDGRAMTRSTAALTILKDLGGLWSLSYAFIMIPRFIRDAVYGFIAKNRYKWFGKKDVCVIPAPELKARFV